MQMTARSKCVRGFHTPIFLNASTDRSECVGVSHTHFLKCEPASFSPGILWVTSQGLTVWPKTIQAAIKAWWQKSSCLIHPGSTSLFCGGEMGHNLYNKICSKWQKHNTQYTVITFCQKQKEREREGKAVGEGGRKTDSAKQLVLCVTKIKQNTNNGWIAMTTESMPRFQGNVGS